MPKADTIEQFERRQVRFLRSLGRGPLGDYRVVECFEENDGVVYRREKRTTSLCEETRSRLDTILTTLGDGLLVDSLRFSTEEEYGSAHLVMTGLRPALPGEVTIYREAQRTEEEKAAAQAADRDQRELRRLRKRYPDQFKET